MPVPSQCYLRTLKIRTPTSHGSSFTIDRHGRQWLVTAAHVVADVDPSNIVVVAQDGTEVSGLEPIPSVNTGADIAVFSLGATKITPEMTLTPSADGVIFSQDAYFLGFPLGLDMKNGGDTYPLVKKSIVSGNQLENAVQLWHLDGINNPGFSGGPVVFNRAGTEDWQVFGVVSAYLIQAVAVEGGAGAVPMNTGIIVCYGINHAVESIDRFTSLLAN